MTRRAVILGAGVMGSAMALPLRDRGWNVDLVGTHLDSEIIASLQSGGIHPRLGVRLPPGTRFHGHEDFAAVMAEAPELVVLGVASAGVNWAVERLCSVLKKPVPLLMITKGMHPEAESLIPLPDVVQDQLKKRLEMEVPVAAIGGPCIAGELAVRRQTGTMIVSRDQAMAQLLCNELSTDYYHPRPSSDMAGVEVCAAFKNFFAIAVGYAKGAAEVMAEPANKAGNNNPAALLFDQAIKELLLLSQALGGQDASVLGMPGAGDLYVTCQAGRNSRLGYHLGKGMLYRDIRNGPMAGETCEGAELGIAVAPTLHAMVRQAKLSAAGMPVTFALLETLVENIAFSPRLDLMHRA